MIHPCENCGETDEHTCVIDGVEYGPWEVIHKPHCEWFGSAGCLCDCGAWLALDD